MKKGKVLESLTFFRVTGEEAVDGLTLLSIDPAVHR